MCVKCWNLLYFIKVLFFDILNSVYMTWIPNVAYSCAIKLSQEPIFSPKLLGNKPTFHEKPRFLACTEQNVRCSGHKIFIDQNWNKLVEGTHGGPPLSVPCDKDWDFLLQRIKSFRQHLPSKNCHQKASRRNILWSLTAVCWLICICAKDIS